MKYIFALAAIVLVVVALTGKYVETQLSPTENYGWQPPTPEETNGPYGSIEDQRLERTAPHLFETKK